MFNFQQKNRVENAFKLVPGANKVWQCCCAMLQEKHCLDAHLDGSGQLSAGLTSNAFQI